MVEHPRSWRELAPLWPEVEDEAWRPERGLRVLVGMPPEDFFARTFFHDGLKAFVVSLLERLDGLGAQAVFRLGDAEGSGRTHALATLIQLLRCQRPDSHRGVLEVLLESGLSEPPAARLRVVDGRRTTPHDCVSPSEDPRPQLLLVVHAEAWDDDGVAVVEAALVPDGRSALVLDGQPCANGEPWAPPAGVGLLSLVQTRLFRSPGPDERVAVHRAAMAQTVGRSKALRARFLAAWPLEPAVIDKAVAFVPSLAGALHVVARAARVAPDGPMIVAPPVAKAAGTMGPDDPTRKRLRAALLALVVAGEPQPFGRVVIAPTGPGDVPDTPALTLVALFPGGPGGDVQKQAAAVLAFGPSDSRRRFRNSVLFVTTPDRVVEGLLDGLQKVLTARKSLEGHRATMESARLKALEAALVSAGQELAVRVGACWSDLLVPVGGDRAAWVTQRLPAEGSMVERAWEAALHCGAVRTHIGGAELVEVLEARAWSVRDHLTVVDVQLVLASALGTPRPANDAALASGLEGAVREGPLIALASRYSRSRRVYENLRLPLPDELPLDEHVLLVSRDTARRYGV